LPVSIVRKKYFHQKFFFPAPAFLFVDRKNIFIIA